MILAEDDLVAFMQIARDDLGETLVVEPGDDSDRDRLAVAQNPEASAAGLDGRCRRQPRCGV